MNKKITTIDDLAVMIGKESQAAEKRFGILEEKMEKMGVDIREIHTDLNDIHADLNGIHKNLNDLNGLHGEIKEIHTDIKGIHKELKIDMKAMDTRTAVIGLEVRVSKLEGSV